MEQTPDPPPVSPLRYILSSLFEGVMADEQLIVSFYVSPGHSTTHQILA